MSCSTCADSGHLQGVAKRLAGQHLAKLLQGAGLPWTPEAARSPEAGSLRKLASQAALAQEMSIYKKGVGKQASACSLCHAPFIILRPVLLQAGIARLTALLHSKPCAT